MWRVRNPPRPRRTCSTRSALSLLTMCLYRQQAKSQCSPSSRLMSTLEKDSPGMRPRFFSQKMAQKLRAEGSRGEQAEDTGGTCSPSALAHVAKPWYGDRLRATDSPCAGRRPAVKQDMEHDPDASERVLRVAPPAREVDALHASEGHQALREGVGPVDPAQRPLRLLLDDGHRADGVEQRVALLGGHNKHVCLGALM